MLKTVSKNVSIFDCTWKYFRFCMLGMSIIYEVKVPKLFGMVGVNEVGIRWKDNALILKVSRTHGDVDVFDGT